MIVIDGPAGEGGGQILRTSLGLLVVTARPYRSRASAQVGADPGSCGSTLLRSTSATQIDVVRTFTGRETRIIEEGGGACLVEVV